MRPRHLQELAWGEMSQVPLILFSSYSIAKLCPFNYCCQRPVYVTLRLLKYKIVPHDEALFFKTKLRIYPAPAMAHTFCWWLCGLLLTLM